VYAVGAAVTGPGRATLDALVPGPDDGVSWARGTLLGTSPEGLRGDDDDGTLTMEAISKGSFH
jgi:hypothetical protein